MSEIAQFMKQTAPKSKLLIFAARAAEKQVFGYAGNKDSQLRSGAFCLETALSGWFALHVIELQQLYIHRQLVFTNIDAYTLVDILKYYFCFYSNFLYVGILSLVS